MSTTNSILDERLHKLIGDWIEEDVTTKLATDTSVISTDLNKWDDGQSDFFNNSWVYITELNNAAADRKIYDYTSSDGACSVRGGDLLSDSASYATCRFYRYSYTAGQRAINDAIRELSGVLFRQIDDRSLVTGNILWDGHLEDWTSDTALRFWVAKHASGALAKTTDGTYIRGGRGTTSAKYTTGGADDYMYQTSLTNPRLLDLMNKTVSLYAWVYPETKDEAHIVVYTLQADATPQTLTSTTACPAGQWTLLKLEDQALNDDLVLVEIRLEVDSSGDYAYFDNVRVTGKNVYEYMLPKPLRDGEVSQVYVQSSGDADYACDDIFPKGWQRVWGSRFFDDGTYRYIRLPELYSDDRQIRLVGTSPLTEVSTFSGTTEIDGDEVDLLVAYAAYCLFRNEEGVPSSEDTSRYRSRARQWLGEYYRLLPSHRMTKPTGTLILPRP